MVSRAAKRSAIIDFVRRWITRAIIAAVILAAAVVLYRIAFGADPVPVTVFVAARGSVEETVTNSKAGTIKARRRARVSPETGGRVAELLVEEGQMIREGAVMVILENDQPRAQVENAARALEAARKNETEACLVLEQAERDLARAENLAREDVISAEMLDQARSKRDVARAACEAAGARARQLDAQLLVTREELAKTEVRAPFDGVVAELQTEKGEWITPSPPGIPMPAILDLIDTGSIYVSAPLDEVDRGRVTVGQRVRITLDAYPGKSFPGRTVRIAPYIEDRTEQSRTFDVEAEFDDATFAKTLPPGASADIEVILQERGGVLRIPTYALLEGRRVMTLEKDCGPEESSLRRLARYLMEGGGECLVSKNVVPGLRNWEFVEVKEGLQVGERVVVSLDRAEVKEGARARQTATAER